MSTSDNCNQANMPETKLMELIFNNFSSSGNINLYKNIHIYQIIKINKIMLYSICTYVYIFNIIINIF